MRTHCGNITDMFMFVNVDSFCQACNICSRHKFCVLDAKKVSENLQKCFLCPCGMPQCCRVLPQTGIIIGHNVGATMCPCFAGPLLHRQVFQVVRNS